MQTTGTTPLCAHCRRPIVGNAPAVWGAGAEPYHLECTRPPSPYHQQLLVARAAAIAERMCIEAGQPELGAKIEKEIERRLVNGNDET